MRITLLVLSLFFSTSAFSWYEKDERYEPLTETVELSALKIPVHEVKGALLRVLLLNNWRIESRSSSQILATQNDSCLLRVDLNGDEIILQEILSSCVFGEDWLSLIRKSIVKEASYYRHVGIAESYLE